MTKLELKEQTLRNLHAGLMFLTDSSEKAAAVVIGMHMAGLGMMKLHDYLDAEEAVMEVRALYAAVEAAHPGRWEALGGPALPEALK